MSTVNNSSRIPFAPVPANDPRHFGGPIRKPNRYRRIVFTLNNYTTGEYEAIKKLRCKWLIVGREVGENGTPHLQGACIFEQQKSLSAIKKIPGFGRAHIETMRGQPVDSFEYCTKEDPNYFQSGTMPKPGKRNDLVEAVKRVQEGQTMKELATDIEGAVAFVKYHKGLTLLRSLQTPEREEPPIVLWLYGPTGTGKTRSAIELGKSYGPEGYWFAHPTAQWFDGYYGQPVAIFDDYRTSFCKFNFLLRLLDRYPLSIPIKGGYVPFVPRIIVITAPYPAAQMWNLRTSEDLAQLSRRITQEIQFDSETTEYDLKQYVPDSGTDNQVSNAEQSSNSGDDPEPSTPSPDILTSESEELLEATQVLTQHFSLYDSSEEEALEEEMEKQRRRRKRRRVEEEESI